MKIKVKVLIIMFLLSGLHIVSTVLGEGLKVKSFMDLKYLKIDRQMAEFTCGVAVLSTLLNYYGIPAKEEEIAEEFFKKMMEEKRGITFLDMKEFALNRGFEAYGYKMNYSGLVKVTDEISLPIVVHMRSDFTGKEVGHFSLLIGVVDDWIVLNDTAVGRKIISVDEFMLLWTGFVLVIKPNGEDLIKKGYARIEKERGKAVRYVSKINFYQNIPFKFRNPF